ncbi:MAG: response regulator transcription factor [Verrucomicrobia bacterium]|nr:response regulator transcription factor [Verrucomicrobiota bacterium]
MKAPQNCMVFIIDDDASVCKALNRLLRSAGHPCETYPSAQAFLARSPHAGPCCVVLDLRMPGLTGLELQEALAAAGRDEPIIFITGHGDVPTCAKAMKAGAVDFLPKPFRDQDLLTAIAKSLDQSRRSCQEREEKAEIQALVDRLTPREQEVLEGVVGGKLNKQIAAELGTCEKTIKVHRGRVMHKMGVVSVAELVRLTQKVRI